MKYKLHKHGSSHFNALLNFQPGTVCIWLSCRVYRKRPTYRNRDQIMETGQNTQTLQKQFSVQYLFQSAIQNDLTGVVNNPTAILFLFST